MRLWAVKMLPIDFFYSDTAAETCFFLLIWDHCRDKHELASLTRISVSFCGFVSTKNRNFMISSIM